MGKICWLVELELSRPILPKKHFEAVDVKRVVLAVSTWLFFGGFVWPQVMTFAGFNVIITSTPSI